MRPSPLWRRIASGNVRNVRFRDLISMLEAFGFTLARTSGSHHIYVHSEIPDQLNLQEVDGQAKPYQVRQTISIIRRYALSMENER